MKQRVITAVLLILLLVILLCLPGWCFALAGLICVGFATWEEYHALQTAGHRVVTWPAWTVLAASVPLTRLYGTRIMVPLMVLALFSMSAQIIFREKPDLVDLAMSALPILTVVLPGLSMVALSMADQKAVEVVLLSITFAVPLMGDMLALFVGSTCGRRKLCPEVSPHKTIEGAIGGLAGSMATSMIIYGLTLIFCNAPTRAKLPTMGGYLLLGLLGGLVGQIGDLFASLVKRHSGIKDFSNLFPGHGGMLDRLDSVLFMAVLVFCYRGFMF